MQQMPNNYPNFKKVGYKVVEELGNNHTGGRFIYKAICLKSNLPIVIKQFRFAVPGNNWSGDKALEREIETLQKLNHPSIPKYINHFDSEDGLCLVMEFIGGVPLSSRTFSLEEVTEIAYATLEILIYVHFTGIIHGDIKPENILIDDKKIYLIDCCHLNRQD